MRRAMMVRGGWVWVLAALGVGCGASDNAAAGRPTAPTGEQARQEPRGEPMPHQSCVDAGGGEVATMDVNGDGQVDIRTLVVDGRPRCRETDANFDGRVDIYRWFDPATGAPARVEDDYDFDGRIDVVATFENGVVARDILDTNFDGRTDTWRDYRNGRVVELRRDADGDGRVDTWERFDDTGRIVYEATDANRDGQPDPPTTGGYTEQAPAAPGTPAPATPAAPAAGPAPATPPVPATAPDAGGAQ